MVEIEELGGEHIITRILPRKNFLERPPCANIDLLALVVSATQPKPNPKIIDTQILIAWLSDIPTVIVLTKCDLASAEPWKEIYEKAGYDVFCVSMSDSPEQLSRLHFELRGKTTVFAGNSGVGKSTLINKLAPVLAQKTAPISQKLGRGRHTTRVTEFFDLGSGTFIVDSPGFSTIDLNSPLFQGTNLSAGFREFSCIPGRCRFEDCCHINEPGCAVRSAAESGEISKSRYKSYLSLATESASWQRKHR